jgi:hypothetical protein
MRTHSRPRRSPSRLAHPVPRRGSPRGPQALSPRAARKGGTGGVEARRRGIMATKEPPAGEPEPPPEKKPAPATHGGRSTLSPHPRGPVGALPSTITDLRCVRLIRSGFRRSGAKVFDRAVNERSKTPQISVSRRLRVCGTREVRVYGVPGLPRAAHMAWKLLSRRWLAQPMEDASPRFKRIANA